MIEADIYRHYGGPGYGLRWEHDGWRAAPDGHSPEDVAEKAIRSMCAILKAPAVEATFRVFERDAKGERVDSGVRIKGHMTAPVIEVVRTPTTPDINP